MATSEQVRAPQPFASDDDSAQWIRHFEMIVQAIKIPDESQCDTLLALPDDAVLRAFDLLDLREETICAFKQLTQALHKRFAPSTGLHELTFSLGQCKQGPSGTLNEYADALVLLTNCAYPELKTHCEWG